MTFSISHLTVSLRVNNKKRLVDDFFTHYLYITSIFIHYSFYVLLCSSNSPHTLFFLAHGCLYMYSSEPVNCMPPPLPQPHCTRLPTLAHPYAVQYPMQELTSIFSLSYLPLVNSGTASLHLYISDCLRLEP